MPLIEGIGDEVILVFAFLAIVIVLVGAWMSTHIREIPLLSLIILEHNQRRRQETQNAPQSQQQAEQVPTSIESENEQSATANEQGEESFETERSGSSSIENSSDFLAQSTPHVQDIQDISTPDPLENIECETDTESDDSGSNLSEGELRRRRIEFLTQSSSSGVDDSKDVTNTENNTNQGDKKLQNEESQLTENTTNSNLNSDENIQQPNNDTSQAESAQIEDQTPESEGTATGNAGKIQIRIKYMNDTQKSVVANPRETIGQFRRNNFAAELQENKLVRFIFNGRDLRNDTETLQSNNVQDNSVLHCLVTSMERETVRPNVRVQTGFDMGNVMLPMFGILLVVIWYLRFEYRQFFTATATISLIGVTSLYIAAILATWESMRRGTGVHEHAD